MDVAEETAHCLKAALCTYVRLGEADVTSVNGEIEAEPSSIHMVPHGLDQEDPIS